MKFNALYYVYHKIITVSRMSNNTLNRVNIISDDEDYDFAPVNMRGSQIPRVVTPERSRFENEHTNRSVNVRSNTHRVVTPERTRFVNDNIYRPTNSRRSNTHRVVTPERNRFNDHTIFGFHI